MPRFLDVPQWYNSSGELVDCSLESLSDALNNPLSSYNFSTDRAVVRTSGGTLGTILLSNIKTTLYVHYIQGFPEGGNSAANVFFTLVSTRGSAITSGSALYSAVGSTAQFIACSGCYTTSSSSSAQVGNMYRFVYVGSATNIFAQTLSNGNKMIDSFADDVYEID